MSGQVTTGSNVRIGQFRQRIGKVNSHLSLSQLATVKQEVSICRKGIRPATNLVLILRQRFGVQSRVPQKQFTIATMGNKMYGVNIGVLGQRIGDLLNSVFLGIQNNDFCVAAGIRRDRIDQFLISIHVLAHKHDLSRRRVLHQPNLCGNHVV